VNLIRSICIACLSLFLPSLVIAAPASFEGFVQVRTGNTLYVSYTAPKAAAPTVVLLNGLTNRFEDWNSFAAQLEKRGLGIVRLDMMGQGRTLVEAGGSNGEFAVAAQVEDVHALLEKLEISKPIHLVGFSYGGGIAQAFAAKYSSQIANLILMSPFTASIESQDSYLRWQVSQHRFLFPFDTRSYDEIYDQYLHIFIFTTYPAADPRLLENPYRLEGVYNLVRGIRRFRSVDVMKSMPKGKVHMMIGSADELIPQRMLEEYWAALPLSVKASRLTILGCGHRIPELLPVQAANWVLRIVDGDPELKGGRSFTLNPWLSLSQPETNLSR
jgi:pimeloyl-ACP methyl ester carboxylesterase